jgi:Lar family restriction alleviation protein
VNEPKPCPFCGDVPDVTKEGHFPDSQGTKWGNLMCGCSAMGPEVRTHYGPWTEWRAAAIEAWNTRAPSTPKQGEGE